MDKHAKHLFDFERAAYRAGLEAKAEGDPIDRNPYDFDRDHTEWEAWRRGHTADAGQS